MQLVTTETSTRIFSAPRPGRSEPLTPKVADELLELLGTDNEFRRLFKNDVVAALAKAGYPPAKRLLAERQRSPDPEAPKSKHAFFCMGVTRMAPKAEIIAARSQLKNYLQSPFTFSNGQCLEAGEISSILQRKLAAKTFIPMAGT